MTRDGTGLRERKKAERRAALIDAAQELALAHGIAEVTVEDICEQADVSRRTFFNYFAAKEDAILAIGSLAIPEAAAEVFAHGGPTGHLLDDIGELVTAVEEQVGDDRPRLARARQILQRDPMLMARHATWMDQHRTEIQSLAERRLAVDDPQVPVVAVLFMATAMLTGMRTSEPGARDAEPAADTVHAVVEELRAAVRR